MAVPNMIVTLAMNATKYAAGLKTAASKTSTFGSLATKAFDLAKGAMLGLTLAAIRFIPVLANMGAESRKAVFSCGSCWRTCRVSAQRPMQL